MGTAVVVAAWDVEPVDISAAMRKIRLTLGMRHDVRVQFRRRRREAANREHQVHWADARRAQWLGTKETAGYPAHIHWVCP